MGDFSITNNASIENAELEVVGGPYSIRSAAEISRMKLPPREFCLGVVPIHDESRPFALLVGAPGVGKSRFALQAAASLAVGREFAHYPPPEKPIKVLIIQSENSVHRLQKDLSPIYRTASVTERELLETNLFITTLEAAMDGDLSIDERNPESGNFVRLKKLITEISPELILVDTWPSVCPNELEARPIRETLMALRKAAAEVRKPLTFLLVCHAKPGVVAAASAFGEEALSFVRGNRNLPGVARAVINFRPFDYVPDVIDANTKVERALQIIVAKANDSVLPEPAAVRLSSDNFWYESIEVNHAAIQAVFEHMAKSKQNESPTSRAATQAESLQSAQSRIEGILKAKGPLSVASLSNAMMAIGVASSQRNAKEMISLLREHGQLKSYQPKVTQPMKILTIEQFKEIENC